MSAVKHAQPFVIRLVAASIAEARASVIVVNHFNGMPPSGAEGAIDSALGGAISRRAARGMLDSHFGGSQFLPASTAPLAASAVLVIGLGEAEKFNAERLPEVGAALVEAVAALGIRDAATILHGSGSAGVESERAARLFVEGLLDALAAVSGAECFRELTITEIDASRLPEIERGILAAKSSSRVHLYVERATVVQAARPLAAATSSATAAVPEYLRIGITRAGTNLKVTVIGDGSFDSSDDKSYPADVSSKLLQSLEDQVLRAEDANARAEALRSIGQQLYEAFLSWPRFDVASLLGRNQSPYLVLRLDQWTVDLPWEILFHDGQFLSRMQVLGRQLEIYAPGRAAALLPPRDTLNVLVIGDPTGDLPSAKREACAVADRLKKLSGARVTALIGDVAYKDVSAELNTTRYDVLHYAGHARFRPGREGVGGLLLKNNVLLTAEDLSTRRFLPQLFFANACNSAQTGDGAEENVFAGAQPTRDLVTRLLQVGVRTFLGSMWRVNDAAAATFAQAFYDALIQVPLDEPGLRRRMSVGQAVCQAREAVIKEYGEGQPAWAAYALYGRPWIAGL